MNRFSRKKNKKSIISKHDTHKFVVGMTGTGRGHKFVSWYDRGNFIQQKMIVVC